MAQPPRQPLFLARPGYRQRRLRDAIRVVPVAGAILLMIPLLWPRGPDGPGNATVLIYVFVVWTALIALSLLLTRRLRTDDDDAEPEANLGAKIRAKNTATNGVKVGTKARDP